MLVYNWVLFLAAVQVSARVILTGFVENAVAPTSGSSGSSAIPTFTVSVRCENGDRATLGELLTNSTTLVNGTVSEYYQEIEIHCTDVVTWYEVANITRTPLGSGVVSVTSGVDARLPYHTSLDLVRTKKQKRAAETRRKRTDEILQELAVPDLSALGNPRKRAAGAILLATIIGFGIASLVVLLTPSFISIAQANAYATFTGYCEEDWPKKVNFQGERLDYLLKCVNAAEERLDELEDAISSLSNSDDGTTTKIEEILGNLTDLSAQLQLQTQNLQNQTLTINQTLNQLESSLEQTIATSQRALTATETLATDLGNLGTVVNDDRAKAEIRHAESETRFTQLTNQRNEDVRHFNSELRSVNTRVDEVAVETQRAIEQVYENMYGAFAKVNDQISRLDMDTSLRLSRLASDLETSINELLDITNLQTVQQATQGDLINQLYQTVSEITKVEYAVPGLLVAYWKTIDRLLLFNETVDIFLRDLGDRPINTQHWSYIGGREFTGQVWTYQSKCNGTAIEDIFPLLNDRYMNTKATWVIPIQELQRFHHYIQPDEFTLQSIRIDQAVEMGLCYNTQTTLLDSPALFFDSHPDRNYSLPDNTNNTHLCHRRLDRNETTSPRWNETTFCPEDGVPCGSKNADTMVTDPDWRHAAFVNLAYLVLPVAPTSVRQTIAVGDVVMFRATHYYNPPRINITDKHYYLWLDASSKHLTVRDFTNYTTALADSGTHFKLDFLRSVRGRYIWKGAEEVSPRRPYLTDDTCFILRPFAAAYANMHVTSAIPSVDPATISGNWFPRYRYGLRDDTLDPFEDPGELAMETDCMYLKRVVTPATARKRQDTPEDTAQVVHAKRSVSPIAGYPPLPATTRYKNMQCQQTWIERTKNKDKLYETVAGANLYQSDTPHTIAELEDLDNSLPSSTNSKCLEQPECMLASVPLSRNAWIKEEGGEPMRKTRSIPLTSSAVEYVRTNTNGNSLVLVVPSGIAVEVCTTERSDDYTICDTFNGPTFSEAKDAFYSSFTMYSDTLTYNVSFPYPANARVRVLSMLLPPSKTYYKAMCVSTLDFGQTATQRDILEGDAHLYRNTLQTTCASQDINTYNGVFIASLEFAHATPHGYFGITMGTQDHDTQWRGVVRLSGDLVDSNLKYINIGLLPVHPPVANDISVIYQTPLRKCWRECVNLEGVSVALQEQFCTDTLGEKCRWETAANRQGVCVEKVESFIVTSGSGSCDDPEVGSDDVTKAWNCLSRSFPNYECIWDPYKEVGRRCAYYSVDIPTHARVRIGCSARTSSPRDQLRCATRDPLYIDQNFTIGTNFLTFKTDMCMFQYDNVNHALNEDDNWCIPLHTDDPDYGLFSEVAGVSRGHRCLDAGVGCFFGAVEQTALFYAHTEPANPPPTGFTEAFNRRNWKGVLGCRAYDTSADECALKSSAPSINRLFTGLSNSRAPMCEGTLATCTQKCEYYRTAHACVTDNSAGKCTWVFNERENETAAFIKWKAGINITQEIGSLEGYFVPYDGCITISRTLSASVQWKYRAADEGESTGVPLSNGGHCTHVSAANVVWVPDLDADVTVTYQVLHDYGFCTRNTFNPATRYDLCGKDGANCANLHSYCNIYTNSEHLLGARNASDADLCVQDPNCLRVNYYDQYTNKTETSCVAYSATNRNSCDTPVLSQYDTCNVTLGQVTGIPRAIALLQTQCVIPEEGEVWEDCIAAVRRYRPGVDSRRQCALELCIEQSRAIGGEGDCGNRTDTTECHHCVFVEVGSTGSRQCYSAGDPQLHSIQSMYPDLAQITLYDDYVAVPRTYALPDVSLRDLARLADNRYVRNPETLTGSLDVRDVFASTGIHAVPNTVDALFPCESKQQTLTVDNEVVNVTHTYTAVGRLCCRVGSTSRRVYGNEVHTACAPDPGDFFTTYENPLHPRDLYHELALDQCPPGNNASEYLERRTVNIYYLCRAKTNGSSSAGEEVDPSHCALTENVTGIEPATGILCFPFMREEDCTENICRFLPAPTACLVDADVGNTGRTERYVRLDATVLTSLQNHEGYPLYDGNQFYIIPWHNMETRRHGTQSPDLVLNGSNVNPVPVFELAMRTDIYTAVASLVAFFGPDTRAWGGTLGDVESVARTNVKSILPDGSWRRLLKQNEAKYAWHTREFVPVYRYDHRRRECKGTISLGGGDRQFTSSSCISDGDNDNLLPRVNDLMIHHVSTRHGIVVNPPTARIVPGGGPGYVAAFHTYGSPTISKETFLAHTPAYDTEIFSSSPWQYANTLTPDRPWCGQILRTSADSDALFTARTTSSNFERGAAFETLLNFQALVLANLTIPSTYAGTGANQTMAAYWDQLISSPGFVSTQIGTLCNVSAERRADPSLCATPAMWLPRIINASTSFWSYYGCTMPFTNFFLDGGSSDPGHGIDLIHLIYDGFLCHVHAIDVNFSAYPNTTANLFLRTLCAKAGFRSDWYYTPAEEVDDSNINAYGKSALECAIGAIFIAPRKYAQCGNCVDSTGAVGYCEVPSYIAPMKADLSARHGLCALSEHFEIEWDREPGPIGFHARARTTTMDLVFQVPLDRSRLKPPVYSGTECPRLGVLPGQDRAGMACDLTWRRCEARLVNPLPDRSLDFVRIVSTQGPCVIPRFTRIAATDNNITIWVRRETIRPNASEVFVYELCPGQFDIRHIPSDILRGFNATANSALQACNQTNFIVQLPRTTNEESFVGLFGTGALQLAGNISLSNLGSTFDELTRNIIQDALVGLTYTRTDLEIAVSATLTQDFQVEYAAMFTRYIDGVDLTNLIQANLGSVANEWTYDPGARNNTVGSNPPFLGDILDHVDGVIEDVGKINQTYENIRTDLNDFFKDYNSNFTKLYEDFVGRDTDITKQIEDINGLIDNLETSEGVPPAVVWAALALGIAGTIFGVVGMGIAVWLLTQGRVPGSDQAAASPPLATRPGGTGDKRYYRVY